MFGEPWSESDEPGGNDGWGGPEKDSVAVAVAIFRRDLGGAVPADRAEMRACMERSGARVVCTEGDPPGWAGLHAFGSIYVSASLPIPERRRVACHLWACYLCWRDRGGPGFSIYDPGEPSDQYRAIAAAFERLAADADPLQPRREPTLY